MDVKNAHSPEARAKRAATMAAKRAAGWKPKRRKDAKRSWEGPVGPEDASKAELRKARAKDAAMRFKKARPAEKDVNVNVMADLQLPESGSIPLFNVGAAMAGWNSTAEPVPRKTTVVEMDMGGFTIKVSISQ